MSAPRPLDAQLADLTTYLSWSCTDITGLASPDAHRLVRYRGRHGRGFSDATTSRPGPGLRCRRHAGGAVRAAARRVRRAQWRRVYRDGRRRGDLVVSFRLSAEQICRINQAWGGDGVPRDPAILTVATAA